MDKAMSAFDEEIEIEIDEIFKKSNNFGYDLKTIFR
ncbi:hypothetical protein SASC598J21_000140 [Snodgrassella alvi SCGC AB-598-J21]|uniref:Uncharacterized protein n=1 Tax=Snodgrassella alvi SCGC AB-598-J21 TaxID=1385367 RepID=A0A074W4B7_9NEIS|nr:hypothetical protein SASC598J21_000140 [Snodgrassella alvi SCGC AB-598-J21]